jgi:hypothetical protein
LPKPTPRRDPVDECSARLGVMLKTIGLLPDGIRHRIGRAARFHAAFTDLDPQAREATTAPDRLELAGHHPNSLRGRASQVNGGGPAVSRFDRDRDHPGEFAAGQHP